MSREGERRERSRTERERTLCLSSSRGCLAASSPLSRSLSPLSLCALMHSSDPALASRASHRAAARVCSAAMEGVTVVSLWAKYNCAPFCCVQCERVCVCVCRYVVFFMCVCVYVCVCVCVRERICRCMGISFVKCEWLMGPREQLEADQPLSRTKIAFQCGQGSSGSSRIESVRLQGKAKDRRRKKKRKRRHRRDQQLFGSRFSHIPTLRCLRLENHHTVSASHTLCLPHITASFFYYYYAGKRVASIEVSFKSFPFFFVCFSFPLLFCLVPSLVSPSLYDTRVTLSHLSTFIKRQADLRFRCDNKHTFATFARRPRSFPRAFLRLLRLSFLPLPRRRPLLQARAAQGALPLPPAKATRPLPNKGRTAWPRHSGHLQFAALRHEGKLQGRRKVHPVLLLPHAGAQRLQYRAALVRDSRL